MLINDLTFNANANFAFAYAAIQKVKAQTELKVTINYFKNMEQQQ